MISSLHTNSNKNLKETKTQIKILGRPNFNKKQNKHSSSNCAVMQSRLVYVEYFCVLLAVKTNQCSQNNDSDKILTVSSCKLKNVHA